MNRRLTQFRQKKSLGQVFLKEDWPCQKMVDQLKANKVESVIEIGPGEGVLTKVLLDAGIHVTAVEKDQRFADRLANIQSFKNCRGNFRIVNQDILKFDLTTWLKETPGSKAICGNIPYNISSSITMMVLSVIQQLKCSTLLVQLEFGQRVASPPLTKAYGSLSVYSQLRSKVRLEYKVPRTCFIPIPKVDSAVISMAPLKTTISEAKLKHIETITRRAFTQRRKMLSNSLSPYLKDIDLKTIPVDLARRCDSLSPNEFKMLAEAIFPES